MLAGREYVASLRTLGFDPELVAWALPGKRPEGPDMELLIVSSWADNIGPKAVYDLLFEAYDASATPKEIDPFAVTLVSPQTQVAVDLRNCLRTLRQEKLARDANPMFILGMFDYNTIPQWVISHRSVKPTRYDDVRHFAAFQKNVNALAA